MLPLPVAIAETDRQVQAFAGQVDPVVVGVHAQFDVRVRGVEGVQPRQQPAHREGADHAHAQCLAIATAGEALQRPGDAVEGLGQHRMQAQAFVGQGDAARQALEQHHTQARLQLFDLMAERGLGHAQFGGGTGQVLVPRRGLEGAQGVQRQMRTDHRQVSIRLMGAIE
ncbi:hypothetical protein NB689_002631 [Xanthomonas sacchari]|nr:hypothetical protein [Xanthomonas sacchari]